MKKFKYPQYSLPLFLLIILWLSYGCATKGGWPTWSWSKNTDQKNEKAAEEYLKTNNPHK